MAIQDATQVPWSRKFSGIEYVLRESWTIKSRAEERKEHYKQNGDYVRVIKTRLGYSIYTQVRR